jgi:hypothetical protein
MNPDLFKNPSLLVALCPVCERSFSGSPLRLVEDTMAGQLLHVKCKHCLSSLILLMFEEYGQPRSRGLATDLTYEEILKYYEGSVVSADDVIRVHTVLQG